MATSYTVSRRSLLATGAVAAGSLVLPAKGNAAATPVLVELFTSQGCSSCPPADKLAGELAQDPRLIVLSFNVDYWDYLGWRDTMAKPEFSQRQYDYARSRGDGKVYTPQMVINGAAHVVGSSKSNILYEIEKAQALPALVTLEVSATEINATVAPFDFSGEATLWLMAVEKEARQEITRGENAGNVITYHNVVRNVVPAGMWKGEALKASWMKKAVMPRGASFCVAVLQRDKTGPVLGIARS
jgi:hypothetical protein